MSNQKLTKALSEMKDQREVMDCYNKDAKRWKEMVDNLERKHEEYVKSKTAECDDLKEQLRDLMFYFEAQDKISASPYGKEMMGGSVQVDEASVPSTSKASRRRKRWARANWAANSPKCNLYVVPASLLLYLLSYELWWAAISHLQNLLY